MSAKQIKKVTADDIRHFMLDRSADDNLLLDAVEIDDPTILKGMEWTVDKYNTTHPLVDMYDVESFPYRAEMIQGAAAYCLRAMAMNHSRNKIDSVTQGGTQVRDKANAAEYLAMAREFSAALEQQFRIIKRTKNVESGYGIVS